ERTELTLLGRNLPGGKPAADRVEQDPPLEQLTVPFTGPSDPAALARLDFLSHPAAPSATARGLQLRPVGLENALNPVTLLSPPFPVTREQEPNDDAEHAQPLTLPTVVCGRFDRPGDADWYSVTLKAGEAIDVNLWAERLEVPGDPYVAITDAKGKELARFDDFGLNFNAL